MEQPGSDPHAASGPTTATDDDGWTVESASKDRVSPEALKTRLETDLIAQPAAEDDPAAAPDGTEPDADTPADTPSEGEPKRKRRDRQAVLDAKIAEKTKAYHEARLAAEAEEARLAALRREADALARRQAAPAKPAAGTPPPAPTSPASGEPQWDDYDAAGKSWSEFQRDHTAWLRADLDARVEAKARETTEARLTTERQRMAEQDAARRFDARAQAVRQKYPDFDQVVTANLSDPTQTPITPFVEALVQQHAAGLDVLYHLGCHPEDAKVLATLPWTRPFVEVIAAMPDPVPMIAWLAGHPDDHERIARLSAPAQLMELGALKKELEGAKSGPPSALHVTNARPPIKPVAGTRQAAPFAHRLAEMDFGPEYVQAANDDDARRGRL